MGSALLLFSGFNRNLIFVREAPGLKKKPPLFVAGHGDGALRADERADSTAFAEIVIDFNVAGLLVSGDAKIGAKIAAQVAAAAEIIPKAPARLQDRCRLVKTGFDLVKVFGGLLFVPARDFQFTWFGHPDFLRLTARSPQWNKNRKSIPRGRQRTQRKTLCTTNVRFLKIFLSKFLVLLSNLFGSFEFWSFEFVSDFVLRIWLRLRRSVASVALW